MKKNTRILTALLLLFAFHLINNQIVILRDSTPFIADASDYYKISFYYARSVFSLIKYGDFYALGSICPMGINGQLLAFLTVPFYLFFGISHDIAILANQTFFIILLLSIFGIGTILYNRRVGLLAAFFISFYPAIFGFSRVYMLVLPISAVSALCVYLLIKSEWFKNLKYSLLFGFALGLGGLLRPRFVIYIIFPALYYLLKNIITFCHIRGWESKGWLVKKRVMNIFFSGACAYLLIFPWYTLRNVFDYFDYQKAWSSWPRLSNISAILPHYLQVFLGVQLGWFFAVLFLFGLVFSMFDKNRRSRTGFILVWFVLQLIFTASFGLKDYTRLLVPLCVPIALISSAGIEGLTKLKIGKYLLSILLFITLAQYLFISYDSPLLNQNQQRSRAVDISLIRGLLQANRQDWKIDEIMSTFKTHRNRDPESSWRLINKDIDHLLGVGCRNGADGFIKVLNIDLRGSPIGNEVEERILFRGLPLSIMGLYPDQFDYRKLFSDRELQCMVLGADYIMQFRTGPEGSEFAARILDIFNRNFAKFEQLKAVDTPWGECLIYGRKAE